MASDPSPPIEDERVRLNRNFSELLQEVRVAQTGVQILFAFLLTLPFTARFTALGSRDIAAYCVSVLGAAAATVLLVAPVSYHRLVFQRGHKPRVLRTASTLAQIGLASFGLALLAGVFLVADVAIGVAGATGFTIALGILLVTLWYVLPLRSARLGSTLSAPDRQ